MSDAPIDGNKTILTTEACNRFKCSNDFLYRHFKKKLQPVSVLARQRDRVRTQRGRKQRWRRGKKLHWQLAWPAEELETEYRNYQQNKHPSQRTFRSKEHGEGVSFEAAAKIAGVSIYTMYEFYDEAYCRWLGRALITWFEDVNGQGIRDGRLLVCAKRDAESIRDARARARARTLIHVDDEGEWLHRKPLWKQYKIPFPTARTWHFHGSWLLDGAKFGAKPVRFGNRTSLAFFKPHADLIKEIRAALPRGFKHLGRSPRGLPENLKRRVAAVLSRIAVPKEGSRGNGQLNTPPAANTVRDSTTTGQRVRIIDDRTIEVLGVQKPVTSSQCAVIRALLEAGPEGLTKDAIEAVRVSAREILKALKQREHWCEVIHLAGTTGRGYRIV